mmetsp:Transcript_2900/g.5530  ORF Transcript_2900/g.5530 Transcript_2900/m.5530 type:complete len:407 (+) Transcript_2900:52-1272(+)
MALSISKHRKPSSIQCGRQFLFSLDSAGGHLSQGSRNLIDIVRRSNEDGATLVDLFRHKVQNTLSRSSDRFTTRLLKDEGHGGSFVQKTELSVRVLGIPRVGEDSSVQQGTVNIADHGTDVTRAVLGSALAFTLLEVVDVGLELGVPVEVVGFIHGVDLATLGDLHVRVSEDELSDGGVEGEAVEAVSGGDHKDGRGRVHAVTRGNEVLSRLESGAEAILLGDREVVAVTDDALFRGLEDTEDGTRGDGGIDVGGTIEWVEGGDVLTGVEFVNDNWIVFLLRGDHAKLSGGAEGGLEDIVGDDIELLLLFALNVDRSTTLGKTSGAGDTSSLDHGSNALAGNGDSRDEANHVLLPRSLAAHSLLDHEAGESHGAIVNNGSGRGGLGGFLGHNPWRDVANGIPATSH